MPITQWHCPQCQADVPLNHFETCTAVHVDYAAAILADRAAQENRTGLRVSMASSCPRKSAIIATEDVAVDPLSYLTAMRGTAWHAVMEDGAGLFSADDGIGPEILVEGVIAGLPISGKIDRVLERNGKLIGQDHKTGKDARAVFIRGGKSYGKQIAGSGAPMEYRIQLSMYAELYRQQFGRAWDAAEIWWTFSAEHWREPVDIIPIEQCLAWRPYDGEFTVEEILKQAVGGASWKELPLVGREFHFGPKFTGCDYCEVRDRCWTEHDGAPF